MLRLIRRNPDFGGASLLLDGTGDFLSANDSADWNFGSSDWTIDLWVRFNTAPSGVTTIISQFNGSTNQRSWLIYADGSNLQFLGSTAGGAAGSVSHFWSWSPSTSTWYHVAVERNGNNMHAYIDGAEIGTADDLTGITFFNSTNNMTIGDSGDGGQEFDGWMDEIRISNVARYGGSNFTPPTQAYE